MATSYLVPNPSDLAPKIYFNTGAVVNSQEVLNPTLPLIDGPTNDGWNLTEWGKQEWINPAVFCSPSVLPADSSLGLPEYAWDTPDEKSVLQVYNSNQFGYVYDLYSANGTGNSNGGACVFLNATALPPTTMDHLINFTMDAKIGQAIGTPADGTASAESGFSFSYVLGAVHYTLFIQLAISDVRGQPQPYESQTGNTFIYDADSPVNTYLPYAADPGPLHYLSYNLNTALVAAIGYIGSVTGTTSSDLSNLANWSLTGFYTGTEVETTGGNIGLGLDVANVSLTEGAAASFNSTDAAASNNGAYHITTDGSGQTVTPAEAGAVVIASYGNDTVNCAAANVTITGSGAMLQINGGPGTLVANAVSDVVYAAGDGDATIVAGGGATIRGGGGSLNLTTGKGSTTIVDCGAGNETISAGGSVTVQGGSGQLFVQAGSGGHSLLVAGSGNATLNGGGAQDTIFGGTGSCTINGAASDVLVAGTGQDNINAGADDLVYGSAGSVISGSEGTLVVAGAGGETIHAGGDGSVVWTSSNDGDTIFGGSGHEVIATFGSAGHDLFEGSNGDYDIFSGQGDTVMGGTGTSVIVAPTGGVVDCSSGQTTVCAGSGDQISGSLSSGANLTAVLTGSDNEIVFGGGTNAVWNGSSPNTFIFNEAAVCSAQIWSVDFATDDVEFDGFNGDAIASEKPIGLGLDITLTNGTEISILHASNFAEWH